MDKSWKVFLAFAGIFVAGGVTGGLMALRVANSNASSGVVEPPPTVSTPTPQSTSPVAAPAVAAAQPAPSRPGGNPFAPPEQLGPQLFRRLTNQLGLSAEQRAKIRPIELRATEELNRLRRESVHSTQVLIDKNEDEIRAELTPEQMAKFDDMVGMQRQKIQKYAADQLKRQREMRKQMFPPAGGNVIASPAPVPVSEPKKQ